MDFDNAKENIMPLAGGRNARCLETVLNAESHHEIMAELQKQRQEFELAIHSYEGDDPLEPWFDYIQWIEQSYPSGGKENGLFDVLLKCLSTFEHNERYFQDRRMVKLYIKYIDTQPNPQEYYQELYNSGIGTMVADLYICWAYYYDLSGNFSKADEIFRKGLSARAQPYDELDQAHKHFGFTMSQRILHKDDESSSNFMSSLLERRRALTSLRTHKKKVGSIRTGAAVKSQLPGKIQADSQPSTSRSNIAVTVFEDQNRNPNVEMPPPEPVVAPEALNQSVVRSIIDSTRKQENLREPGPWSKAGLHDRRKGSLFPSSSNHEIPFEIMEDDSSNTPTHTPLPKGPDNVARGIQLPPNFVARNQPQSHPNISLWLDNDAAPNSIPAYEKYHLYPKADQVYSHEELAGYNWFKRHGIENAFTRRHDPVWSANIEYGFHFYPNFAAQNLKQNDFNVERYIADEDMTAMKWTCPFNEIYPTDRNEEFQIEEILARRLRTGERNLRLNADETIILPEEMDETVCVVGADRRKSYFPTRKSIVPSGGKAFPGESSSAPSRMSGKYRRSIAMPPPITLDTVSEESLSHLSQTKNTPPAEPHEADKAEQEEIPLVEPTHEMLNIYREIKETPATEPNEENAVLLEIPSTTKRFEIFEDVAETPLCSLQLPVAVSPKASGAKFEIFEDTNAAALPASQAKFEIFQDTSVSGPLARFQATQTAPKSHPLNNFEIFKDPCTDDSSAAKVFKTPALPMKFRPPLPPPTFEVDDDETCSTQTFNLFIKTQSVSTPKHGPKPQRLSTAIQEVQQQSDEVVSPPLPDVISPPSDSPDTPQLSATNSLFPQKQLSVIMEITETNTVSSGTKSSSGETHDFDSDSVKSQNTVKGPNSDQHSPPLDPIAEVSSTRGSERLEKSLKSKERELDHAIGGEEIPATMISMKVFEEKTETVPKIVLRKIEDDDNFCNLFTTTPPKSSTKLRPVLPPPEGFCVDDSMTFSKLQEITAPNIPEPLAEEKPAALLSMFSRLKCSGASFGAMPEMKPEIKSPESFAINDSMSLWKLGDSLLPKTLSEGPMVDLEQQAAALPQTVPNKSTLLGFESFELKPTVPKETIPRISIIRFEPTNFPVDEPPKKQSTGFPPFELPRAYQIQEASLHIKEEPEEQSPATNSPRTRTEKKSLLTRFSEISRRQSQLPPTVGLTVPLATASEAESPPATPLEMKNQTIIWLSDLPVQPILIKDEPAAVEYNDCNETANLGRSIYVPSPSSYQTPYNPRHCWSDEGICNSQNIFVRPDIDLDHTRLILENKINEDVNPFDPTLIKAFLDQIDLISFIGKLPNCEMVNRVKALHKGDVVKMANRNFDVIKMIGEGNYGTVFCAKEQQTGALYALKQEKPANLWEYYICLELNSRIRSEQIMQGFMNVDYALIGNNASILITPFSKYGTLINVCNKVHSVTGRNVDEFVVMILASQLLSIMDHLHASNIIHADIKPDNFLVISKLSYPSSIPALQLIDFGVAIDLCLFRPDQTFRYVNRTDGFTCIEMLEGRPWTFQTDLFGLAATIHVLLFGKYMDVQKGVTGWSIKNRMPRYFNKSLWNTIFGALLNIRDCKSMPNLQQLRRLLEEEIAEKERLVRDKLNEFNNAIEQ